MASKDTRLPPKWLIDTHGMRAALTTQKNSVRVAIIAAIECGQMHILKGVSEDLKAIDPDGLYKQFQDIKHKKYEPVSVASSAAASIMMEKSGASVIGSMPPVDRFEALAVSRRLKCILVSSGKAHGDCKAIATKNHFPAGSVCDVSEFA